MMYRRLSSESGVILYVVLWALVILTGLAVSLGRQSNIELSMLKYEMGKVKSKYISWAGFNYVLENIHRDSLDPDSSKFDTLRFCAIPMDDEKSLKEMFEKRELNEGFFEVQYQEQKGHSEKRMVYGVHDEERLININAITIDNIDVFKSFLNIHGVQDEDALNIAYAIIDWKDFDDFVAKEGYGAEDDYYMGLYKPYHVKNNPFDSKAELLLVKGMTRSIYDKIKDQITIFPKEGMLKVNFDTAEESTMKAIARSVVGPQTNTDASDADSLVAKILEYRSGEDKIEQTLDDRLVEQRELPLNAKETVIYRAMNKYRTKISEYVRVKVRGVETRKNIETHIDAVVKRKDLSVVSWERK